MIKQPELPYELHALEPIISETTMNLHYNKHHKGYYDNLKKLIENTEYQNKDLEELVKQVPDGPLFNNAGQALNHNLFWMCMSPESDEEQISPELLRALESKFDSLDGFKQKFKDTGTKLFGSGWVWLVANKEGTLKIQQFKNGDTPLRHELHPILPCDVWEHAFYLDYHNDKGRYIDNFWSVVNWKQISEHYQQTDKNDN